MEKKLTDYYYRSRRHGETQEPSLADLTKLPIQRLAVVYQRLSSHEQVKDHVFSVKMQDALIDMAKADGYPDELICVEKRDIGLSGTLTQDERPGLAHVIQLIEQDRVESIYVVHLSRLYRDQTLIDGFAFGELCKEHSVVLITPHMRLNLRNDMHMRMYRMELDWSAQELKMIKQRMSGARTFKLKQGFYAGGPLTVGFILDTNKDSPTFEKYLPYPPHAEIVKIIFDKTLEYEGALRRVVRECRDRGKYFPFFPPELAPIMDHRTSLRRSKRHSKGWIVTYGLVRSIVTNPAYIGWWLWKGEVVSHNNHEPIVDEDVFWAVQEILNSRSKGRRKPRKAPPLPLSWLLYCGTHTNLQLIYSSSTNTKYSCENDWKGGLSNKTCLSVSSYILDKPICDFIISQCSYPVYADSVIDHLKSEREQVKERLAARKRGYERLSGEIENLKSHLAITKSSEQAEMILAEIDKRMRERKTLMELKAQPIGRLLTKAEVKSAKEFLVNIKAKWDDIPDELKNEFLRIILDKIILHHEDNRITAEIIWKTGLVQKILIYRPYKTHDESHFWSSEEERILREHYSSAGKDELLSLLPGRTWFAITHKARKLSLSRKNPHNTSKEHRPFWTSEQDEVVRRFYGYEIDIQEAIELTGRTRSAIYNRGSKHLKLRRKRVYRKPVEWVVIDDGFGGEQLTLGEYIYDTQGDSGSAARRRIRPGYRSWDHRGRDSPGSRRR